LAHDNLEPVRESLDIEGTLDQEKVYWKQTFAQWTDRFGAFKGSEVIGTTREKEIFITYVLLRFERGTTVVQFRQNADKKFYIGTAVSLFPRYYRLIPKSKTEFVVYNNSLQTNTPIKFSFDAKGNINGLTVQNQSYSLKRLDRENY